LPSSCRSQFRRAQLSAKRAEEAFKRREREQLFSNLQDSDGHPRGHGKKRNQEKLSQDELAVNASQDVTAALRRTHQLMQSEYERSEFARETLRNSTDALNSLSESYSSLDTLLAASRGFIRTLVTSQKSDTWYLETTVKLLIALVIWLVFRRIFWGPITWFVLWPSKLVFKLLFSVLHVAASIFGGGQSVDSTAAVSSHSRPPLKIQPSASNRAPPMQAGGDARMRTGAGGSKDRKRLHNENPDTLSEQVGKMVENTQNQEKGGIRKEEKEELHDMEMNEHKEGEEGGGELKDEDKHDTTGDGTKLKARGPDEKPNPKKRMFEDPPEKQRERDEL
jgi:protein transport protein SEC20